MSLVPSNSGKSLSLSPSTSHSPAPPSSTSGQGFESSRRNASSNQNLTSSATLRKGQVSRKQHRNSTRPQPLDRDDAMAEMRAVRNPNSRRGQTSITHLLNYSVPSSTHYDHGNHGHHQYHNRSYRRNPTGGQHAMDKFRYVHANYRFIVTPAGSYAAQASNADEHLEWTDVLQILASAESQDSSCPICLSKPVAPRMAKCGHIFCLPCLLRFMNSASDETTSLAERKARWKKCPICEDQIYISEVRPVRFYAGQESALPRPGDDVVLRLMMRSGKSTLALPKEAATDVLTLGEEIPWIFAASVLDYARIMKGTGDYMNEEYDREVEELVTQEKEDELMFHEDGEWTQKAVRSINAARERIKDLGGVELALAQNAPKTPNPREPAQPDPEFHFYTSPPHLYLSPLDIRILKTNFGDFSLFPTTLLPQVEHISTGHVVDDALRKRVKYLSHLPHGCLVSFLECDWTDIVSAEILATFAEEIDRRRKRNRDKAIQEERERLQAERLEAAAIRSARRAAFGGGALPEEITAVRYSSEPLESSAVNPDDFVPLGAQATTPPNPRTGFAQLAGMSTSPSDSRTVWGTQAISLSPELAPMRPLPLNVDDGWMRDDRLLDSLGVGNGDPEIALQMEALGVAMEKSELEPVPSPALNTGGNGGNGGGKKKKKQKITLMSTVGRRGN